MNNINKVNFFEQNPTEYDKKFMKELLNLLSDSKFKPFGNTEMIDGLTGKKSKNNKIMMGFPFPVYNKITHYVEDKIPSLYSNLVPFESKSITIEALENEGNMSNSYDKIEELIENSNQDNIIYI